MRLIIKINMENSAFEDPDELPRILRKLADRVSNCNYRLLSRYVQYEYPSPGDNITLLDIDGNSVGLAKFTK